MYMGADDFCINCKRQGRVFCPHINSLYIKTALEANLKEDVSGPSPPNVFIGHFGYPNLNYGPMIAVGDTVDNPSKLYGLGFEDIVKKMSSLVRGQSKANAKMPTRIHEGLKETVMSVKSVDMEAKFSHKPLMRSSLDSVLQPMGPVAPLKELRITGNAAIPRIVDNLVDDKIGAADASIELFGRGFDSHYLTKLLSAGVLGKKNNQRLVPTRWAITATDDMLSKAVIEKVKELPSVEEFLVFTNEYLFNHFEVLVMPGNFEYEQFEAAVSEKAEESHVSEDWEGFDGRTKYSEAQGGGYYAARFGITEGLLKKVKKQGRVVLFREILPDYNLPVGVWEVRENARHAMQNIPRRFENLQQALGDIFTRLRVSRRIYLSKSRVLRQRRLTEF